MRESSWHSSSAMNPPHDLRVDSSVLDVAALSSPSAAVRQQHHHRSNPVQPAKIGGGDAVVDLVADDMGSSLRSGGSSSYTHSKRSHGRRSRRRASERGRGSGHRDALREVEVAGLALCCDGVTVEQGGRPIIDDVSCLFRGGRVTAVVNACGTHSALALLTVVAGQIESTAGNTVLNGMPVSASAYGSQVSFLEEGGEARAMKEDGGGEAASGLHEQLTVRENLCYACVLRVADSAQAYSVDEVLQQLLLIQYASSRVADCGLYVRRRVALAKELLLNPTVLVLDEPLEGLTTHEAQQFLTILSKLAAPSAADAEAQRIMRQAMSAAAAAAVSPGLISSTGSETRAASPTAVPTPEVAFYEPRRSRLRGKTVSGAADGPADHSNTAVTAAPARPLRTEAQRIVVLSMVQPRWVLLQYVHDVVLMERSRCVFQGTVQEMLSVNLPACALRTTAASLATARATVAAAAPRGSTDLLSLFESNGAANGDSYDAVDASIRRQRWGEEFVHALYRLATAPLPPDGDASRVADEASSRDEVGRASEPALSRDVSHADLSPTSGADVVSAADVMLLSTPLEAATVQPATAALNASPLMIHSEDPIQTPLSHLYVSHRARSRAEVTTYMEACALGLPEFPLVFHQTPHPIVRLLYLFRFGLLEMRNNLLWNAAALAAALTLAAALAALYGRQRDQEGMQNRLGILFFLVSCVVLQAVLSLDAQRREYEEFQRYSASGYYGAWTYLIFRTISAALWRFGLAAFVALVVFVLSNFGAPWREYRGIFELSVILAVTSLCCHVSVWFLCSWWPTDRVGRFVVFAFYTLNIILAGLVLNLRTLPRVVQALSFASVMRLAFESCILTQFVGKSFGCRDGNIGVARQAARSNELHTLGRAVQSTTCYTGSDYAHLIGFDSPRRWSNVGVLAGISAVLLVGSWVMTTLYRPRRRRRTLW